MSPEFGRTLRKIRQYESLTPKPPLGNNRESSTIDHDDAITSGLNIISHSARDTWVAKQIAREITACGAKPFLDEADIDVGSDFEEDILAFLKRANELVVLLTPWALDRPYVWAELGAAWGRRIPVVAILLGLTPAEVQSRPGVPIFFEEAKPH